MLKGKGFSIFELIVVIAVIAVLAAVTLFSFGSQTKERSLRGEELSILATLEQARILAMNSKENSDFGVHFLTNEKILFIGSAYNSSDLRNLSESIASGVEVADISLNGGGNSVVFSRLTGRTDDYGTIKIHSIHDNSASSTITIYQTGFVEIE